MRLKALLKTYGAFMNLEDSFSLVEFCFVYCRCGWSLKFLRISKLKLKYTDPVLISLSCREARRLLLLTCLVYNWQSSRENTGHHQHRYSEKGQYFNNEAFHLKCERGKKLRQYRLLRREIFVTS